PHDAEDYVHRIGRTARAGEEGVAVTLVGERERRKFKYIEDFLGKPVERGQLPEYLRPKKEEKQPEKPAATAETEAGAEKKGRGRGDRQRSRRNWRRRKPQRPREGGEK
ncbi:MAG: hypothetical protein K2J09_08800, partial [Muribaculaceae bacterium]|nr:hypothetical protein [Muribaculaceae bacterium]